MQWRLPGRRRALILTLVGTFGLGVWALTTERGSIAVNYLRTKLGGGYTLAERLEMHSGDVTARLQPAFAAAGLAYPPAEVAYVAIKQQRELMLYARMQNSDAWTFVSSYPVLAQSGQLGPKLREGDRQVPEGIYRVEFLNPNSLYHLSLRLSYPNSDDRAAATIDGRTALGGDIMIHGSNVSIGCIAVGNQAAEDLFVLAAQVGKERVRVVISPVDFRLTGTQAPESDRPWIKALYATLDQELRKFPRRNR
jgi:murein L,D-transpeptidase YafK